MTYSPPSCRLYLISFYNRISSESSTSTTEPNPTKQIFGSSLHLSFVLAGPSQAVFLLTSPWIEQGGSILLVTLSNDPLIIAMSSWSDLYNNRYPFHLSSYSVQSWVKTWVKSNKINLHYSMINEQYLLGQIYLITDSHSIYLPTVSSLNMQSF